MTDNSSIKQEVDFTMLDILISIIVPIYNIADKLDRCVESLINQDYNNLEILLIDDGSPDDCGKMCDKWAETDSRVKAYHKTNGGLSDARNYGIDKANGKYVIFVDGDDYIPQCACSALVSEAEAKNADMVTGNVTLVAQKNTKSKSLFNILEYNVVYSGKDYLYRCLKNSIYNVEVWRTMYKTEFLKNNTLYFKKGIYHEDEEFTPRVYLKADRVVFIEDVVYVYDNTNPVSITNSTSNNIKKAMDSISIGEQLVEIYKSVEPKCLRELLLDSVCWKYLACVCKYCLCDRPDFVPKKGMLLKYSHRLSTKIKALIFGISPSLYCKLNKFIN